MTAYIARDPFARGEYRRECHANSDHTDTCQWCGASPTRLYSYEWEGDSCYRPDRKHSPRTPLFCNKSCHDAYNS